MLRPGVKEQLPAVNTMLLLLVMAQKLLKEVQLPGAEQLRQKVVIPQRLATTRKLLDLELLPGADIMIAIILVNIMTAELPAAKLLRPLGLGQPPTH